MNSEFRKNTVRQIKIYTGAGGLDLYGEAFDKQVGYERVYIGFKVLRILRKLKSPIRKSMTKGFYKIIKINLENPK